jgi:hypothetical protein
MKNIHLMTKEESKQETLEEAAERFYPISKGGSMWMPSAHNCNQANKQEGFIEGAKWQAERMYSEEEIAIAFNEGQAYSVTGKLVYGNEWVKTHKKEWFEEVKKK